MRQEQWHSLVAVIAAGAAMAVAGYGAYLVHPLFRGVSDSIYGLGAALLIVASVIGAVQAVRVHFGYRGSQQAPYLPYAEAKVQQQKRAAELAADPDPVRRAYATRVASGEAWSDADIAYCKNPAQLNSCAHLQYFEQAMRHAGIWTRPYGPRVIFAHCRINEPALRTYFVVPGSVVYQEGWEDDRYRQNPKLYCNSCNSAIELADNQPWFPEAPKASVSP